MTHGEHRINASANRLTSSQKENQKWLTMEKEKMMAWNYLILLEESQGCIKNDLELRFYQPDMLDARQCEMDRTENRQPNPAIYQ